MTDSASTSPWRRTAGYLSGLCERLSAADGWRRRAWAAGLGALAAIALPPFHAVPLLVPALVGFLCLIGDGDRRRAFSVGWWFGLGHFAAGLYWISGAFLVFPEQHAWMAPLAVLGLAATMAFFPAAAALATVLSRTRGWRRVLFLGAAWAVLEWVRGWILTGLPWNLMGTVWTFSDGMIQITAFTGTYGLSLLTVVAAAMPVVLTGGQATGGAGRRSAATALVITYLVLAAVFAGGLARLAGAANDMVPGVWLRLVQPNIPQALKWRSDLRLEHVMKQIRMSLGEGETPGAGGRRPTHILWAETAVPFFLTAEPQLLEDVASVVPPRGLLITGAPRRGTAGGDGADRIWNSLHAIDAEGRVAGTYDKFHLVPFGEYIPLAGFLGLDKLTAGKTDFSPGPGLRTLTLPGLPPVSPLICFEVIFPGRVADRRQRPSWLLNLTNDGWYGYSTGPFQHFAAARLRAVEEGLPLVRVANTGISAVVDAYGRTVASLGLDREGVIDSGLPMALENATPYGRWGDTLALSLLLAAAGGALVGRRGTGPEDKK